jgi:polyisoprenoid-binding protein YceI
MNLKNVITSGLFILTVISLTAQTYKLKTKDITVSGTSTLHKWTSDITQANGQGVFQFEDNQLTGISSLELTFPVKGIISTKGKIMDNKTWESLKSDNHPNVIYTYQGTDAITKTASGYTIKVKGNLQIAGFKKAVSMQINGNILPGGKIHFTGKHAIVLPSYNIEPPKALMGTVVVGEEVVVAFDVTFEKI